MISFTIPGHPVAWSRPVRGKNGGTYNPPKMERAEKNVMTHAWAACANARWKCTKDPVTLEVRFFYTRWPGDLSNCTKLVEDAMRKIIYWDDRQVVSLDAAMFRDKDNPRTEVVVRLAGEKAAT